MLRIWLCAALVFAGWPAGGASPPSLRGLYPSAELVPENLARLGVCYSQVEDGHLPRAALEDGRGQSIELPVSSIAGLSGCYTAQVTRGSLRSGGRYRLVLTVEWTDAAGELVTSRQRKDFRAGPADRQRPDPKRWRIAAPDPDTDDTLTVDFDEPLDYLLFQGSLTLLGPTGPVAGHPGFTKEETRWVFEPESPWLAGAYRLVIASSLTDLAGNRVISAPGAGSVSLRFQIR